MKRMTENQNQNQNIASTVRTFRRSNTDRMIAGVCGGAGAAYGIDPVLLRVALAVATVLGFGVGAVIYLACWVIVPLES